ncbi:MAG TPA: UPF0182 family protein [Vicinamibacterales bacterium]|nr:UPF0182 family protein [Vicinamibacterales bacterium]
MQFPGGGRGRDDIFVRGRRDRRGWAILAAVVFLLIFGAGTIISWYVEALWFGSLGYDAVFWTTLTYKTSVFWGVAVVTFLLLFGAFRLLRPRNLAYRTFYVNNQPVSFSLEPVVRTAAWALAGLVALIVASSVLQYWDTIALYIHAPAASGIFATGDPIFGRPVPFYLFTLPFLRLVFGWVTTIAVVVLVGALAAFVLSGEASRSMLGLPPGRVGYRDVSLALGAVLLVFAGRVYLSRFDRLFEDHTVFAGVGYADASIAIPGLVWVAAALAAGAAIAIVNGLRFRRAVGLAAALAPAVLVYVGLSVTTWYVTGFVVKPNELVRERPYISNNIRFTRMAYALDEMEERSFPAETSVESVDLAGNLQTLDNIRLWDWRPLQETLRQIQEIRTYYDFADIDLDRYQVGGQVRQMMVAAREMNLEKLPESSRNWINEKLIYTHGYGVTMNTVNGFTAEGLPELVLQDMPVQSKLPEITVTRPEIYFGEITNTDVYVRTQQREFNYPQGETNAYTSYDGKGGIEIKSFARRLLLAANRGDLSKLPFSDDVTNESRLLMRRNIRERVRSIAPFLIYDADPYIVVGEDGRLYWMMDGFTYSNQFPYARAYQLGPTRVNYLRNSVKVVIDAYDGTVDLYVFDAADPIIAAYRGVFPTLFRDAGEMPEHLRAHVRYPELLLQVQAAAYSLYHMEDPDVFYNREDLWSVPSEVTSRDGREQGARPVEPNFIVMRLPGETELEFVEILPFTPANRNNLIAWMAGRSDGEHYGTVRVYNFSKSRLVDGPLQVEARIDQNPNLSEQLTLWSRQGSNVRRGSLLVIPVGRALLYAKPIYLQAERSPMPQLRLVVLALQDRLGYGPTLDVALRSLFGEGAAAIARAGAVPAAVAAPATEGIAPAAAAPEPPAGVAPSMQALVDQAARELAEYQRLTAEGRLGEAGQRLESVKRLLDQLQKGNAPGPPGK